SSERKPMGGEAKLAQCPRCHQHTLVAERMGVRVAIDVAPADALGFGVAVAGGVGLWWAQNEPGQPSRVLSRYAGGNSPTQPSWAPGGAQSGSEKLHAEHSCGAPARDQVILSVSSPKSSAPATPGAPKAGSHPGTAPAGATPGPGHPSPAGHATSQIGRAHV